MLRRLSAGGLGLAVLVATAVAPLVHAHPDLQETDGLRARVVHSHLGNHVHAVHTGHEVELTTADQARVTFLDEFVAVSASTVALVGAVSAPFSLTIPTVRSPHVPLQAAGGHDPPIHQSVSSRAPPAR